MNYNAILTDAQLQRCVPSIYTREAQACVSDKYVNIPTIDIVNGLQDSGYYPVAAMQCKSREKENRAYAKHLIRFRYHNDMDLEGMKPEIVLVNSHDGKSSYQLRAGIYRIACANGMIVGGEVFSRRIRHQGDIIGEVIKSANEITEIAPKAMQKAISWKGIVVDELDRNFLAKEAALLKWDEEEIPLSSTSSLLLRRRRADAGNDLWSVFNVLQENIVRGGIGYRTDRGGRNRTRGIASVNENVRINTKLWDLAEKYSARRLIAA